MNKSDQIRNMFPTQFHSMLSTLNQIENNLQEIRIRVNCPCIFVIGRMEFFPDKKGRLHKEMEKGVVFSKEDVDILFNHICNYSPYAYENQLKQGFLTVAGGHRVGVCGQVVLQDGKIALMKQVQFLHIRIVHEIMGVGDELLPYLFENGQFLNTLIISSPGVGKTTMLRDLTKSLSDGNQYADGKQICIVDERSELAGCYMGVPQNHVGKRTDVLDACPKAEGMMMAIRSMGPEIIVVDELGLQCDYEAVEKASVCGIKILASVHGDSLYEIYSEKNTFFSIIKKVFHRLILLRWKKEKDGTKKQVWSIYDNTQKLLTEKG